VLQIAAAVALLWLIEVWKTPWNARRYIGTVLVVVGVGFLALARFQLGKSFSAKAEAHELVTRGLYSKIRNPIYVFGGIVAIGVLLVLQQPTMWVVLMPTVIVQVIRARQEAKVLEAAFGDEYRQNGSKTWL